MFCKSGCVLLFCVVVEVIGGIIDMFDSIIVIGYILSGGVICLSGFLISFGLID